MTTYHATQWRVGWLRGNKQPQDRPSAPATTAGIGSLEVQGAALGSARQNMAKHLVLAFGPWAKPGSVPSSASAVPYSVHGDVGGGSSLPCEKSLTRASELATTI